MGRTFRGLAAGLASFAAIFAAAPASAQEDVPLYIQLLPEWVTAPPPAVANAPRSSAGILPGTRVLGMSTICEGDCTPEIVTTQCKGILESPNFDANGVLWLADPVGKSILKVDSAGRCEKAITLPGRTPSPAGIKFSRDGMIYGTDTSQGLFWADPKTGKGDYITNKFSTGPFGDGNFHGVDDLVFDAVGGLYFTDQMGSSVINPVGRVFYRTPDGKLKKVADGNLAHPDGIALSPKGDMLYISEWLGGRIIAVPVVEPGVIDVDQSFVLAYLDGGRPDGMAVDQQGNVYIAQWGAGGMVSVFSPDGSFYGAITAPKGEAFTPTNVSFHKGWLYIADARSKVWRVKTRIPGAPLYGDAN